MRKITHFYKYFTFTTVFSLCFTPLFGAYDYAHCVKYFNAASTTVGDTQAISIKNGKKQLHIMYAPIPPDNVKILKSDPFIGLYLVSLPTTKQSYDLLALDNRTLNDKNLAAISRNTTQKGSITKRQKGFVHFAHFSAKAPRNGVLGNICYQIYGLTVGNQHFIEKRYIDRFIAQKSPYYGDLGIRFEINTKKVLLVDPFATKNPFMPDDEILSINGKTISSGTELEWEMSNLKKDSVAKVRIRRQSKILTLNAQVGQRYGGFLLRETFLERFGIVLDENMYILSIDLNRAGRFKQLREGDKILWINKQPIITSQDLSTHERFERLKFLLSQTHFDERFDGKIQLLIIRNDLEIFVKV